MGNLNKKIVVRLTKRQLEYLVEETIKDNITISQVVRKALIELLITRGLYCDQKWSLKKYSFQYGYGSDLFLIFN
jgi:hypothetical protein